MRATIPEDVLRLLGGTATSRELVVQCGRRAVAGAVADGRIERPRRGMYTLPSVEAAIRAGRASRAVVSHVSAAQLLGLDVAIRPARHHLTVGRDRRRLGRDVVTHWANLSTEEIASGVTSPVRTVLDCARTLPFREGLTVADSALRTRVLGAAELTEAADALHGAGRSRVRRVAAAADGRAGSALESLLRATLLDAGFNSFEPQVVVRDVGFFARVDLADRTAGLVLEADSYTHHGGRSAHVEDCARYDELAVRGWTVLRFAWEHVMFEPAWVVATVRAARDGRPELRTARRAELPRSA